MHTSKRFDKGGLSRAVIADKGDDFAGKDFQIDIGQCRNSAEILGYTAKTQHRLR
ncbi:hypothetical protein C032_02860 [Brucella abortus 63/294]|nr:hypothetical protein C032_02860 [Brucella abortus 63/294]ENS08344.1 hypothetical protein C980_02837 [Brucella abortus 88/217]ERU11172.1 hypothetical protein P039_00535 [Brucella abortus 07-0994-2411]